MKKIILTMAAVFALSFANAQDKSTEGYGFSKGNMFVEGAFSLRSGNTSQNAGDTKTGYVFNPTFGYMVNDKVAIGGRLDISGQQFYGENADGVHKANTFGISAFARYYFLSLADNRFTAYGQASLGYSGSKYTDINGNDAGKPNGMNFGLDLGMNYFITHHWAATFTLSNIASFNTLTQGGHTTNGTSIDINKFNNIFATPQFGLLYKW